MRSGSEPPPGFVKAVWFKSGRHRGGLTGELPVVTCLSFCGWDIADGLEQTVVGEPGYPFQRGQLDGLLGLPECSAVDQFGLTPVNTPVCSPQSNGMAESFVNTFKRDYVSRMDLTDTKTVLAQLPAAFEHFNEVHPHSSLKMKSPREFRQQRVEQLRRAQSEQPALHCVYTVSGNAGARSLEPPQNPGRFSEKWPMETREMLSQESGGVATLHQCEIKLRESAHFLEAD